MLSSQGGRSVSCWLLEPYVGKVSEATWTLQAGARAGLSVQVEGRACTWRSPHPAGRSLRARAGFPWVADAVTILTVFAVPSTTTAVVTWLGPFHYYPPLLHGRIVRLESPFDRSQMTAQRGSVT